MDNTNCNQCGKPVRTEKSGSLTQWLLTDACQCNLPVAPAPPETKPVIKCAKCGLQKQIRKKGSLTQWIFSANNCKCEVDFFKSDSKSFPEIKTEGEQKTSFIKELKQKEIDYHGLEPDSFPFERYRIISKLGSGGSASVFQCLDITLEKIVAIKIITSIDSADKLVQFQQEARAASRLNHPNVLKILDFGASEGGSPFMVMEFVEGFTLAQLIKTNGTLSPKAALHLLTEVAEGVGHAHEIGILHRDLKPENIMISNTASDDFNVKVIDFGIATLMENTLVLTEGISEELAGSPLYMSPDQILGYQYTESSDIYSIGCIVFEALTGALPITGATPLDTLYMRAKSNPPELTLKNDSPESMLLERILKRCLAKLPKERYSSTKELLDDLKMPAEADRIEVQPEPKIRNPKVAPAIWISVSLAALVVCFVIFSLSLNSQKEKSITSKTKDESVFVQIEKIVAKTSTDSLIFQTTYNGDNPIQQIDLAKRFYTGDGVKRDRKNALLLAIKAAEAGNAEAQVMAGEMYRRGEGADRDFALARHWFKLAADSGNIKGFDWLGHIYRNGEGVAVDYKKAMEWSMKAAQKNYAPAQNRIGMMYENGQGVAVDYKKAMHWYRLASKENAGAIFSIGRLYEKGKGVKPDLKTALTWYRKAAVRGYAPAIRRLRSEPAKYRKMTR